MDSNAFIPRRKKSGSSKDLTTLFGRESQKPLLLHISKPVVLNQSPMALPQFRIKSKSNKSTQHGLFSSEGVNSNSSSSSLEVVDDTDIPAIYTRSVTRPKSGTFVRSQATKMTDKETRRSKDHNSVQSDRTRHGRQSSFLFLLVFTHVEIGMSRSVLLQSDRLYGTNKEAGRVHLNAFLTF